MFYMYISTIYYNYTQLHVLQILKMCIKNKSIVTRKTYIPYYYIMYIDKKKKKNKLTINAEITK